MNFTPEALWGVGIIILMVALIWGTLQYNRRNRANEPITEAATRAQHKDPEHYEQTAEQLKKQVRPS